MDILNAVSARKSIREFNKKPVSKKILQEILNAAVRTPSANNTQPWDLTVISGDVLDGIRQDNIEKLNAKIKITEVPSDAYQGVYRQRQIDLAVEIFKIMGIAREDKIKRAEWRERGFRFFDAPAAIIISTDRSLDGTWSILDIGCLSQTICLVALKYGLGTCIEGQGVSYPEVIRKFTGIPETKRIIISIAIGYPDLNSRINSLSTQRDEVNSVTTWHGFTEE